MRRVCTGCGRTTITRDDDRCEECGGGLAIRPGDDDQQALAIRLKRDRALLPVIVERLTPHVRIVRLQADRSATEVLQQVVRVAATFDIDLSGLLVDTTLSTPSTPKLSVKSSTNRPNRRTATRPR
jgi:hypothetical protein